MKKEGKSKWFISDAVSIFLTCSFSQPLDLQEFSTPKTLNYKGPTQNGREILKVFLSVYRAVDLKVFRSSLVSALRHIRTVRLSCHLINQTEENQSCF